MVYAFIEVGPSTRCTGVELVVLSLCLGLCCSHGIEVIGKPSERNVRSAMSELDHLRAHW